MVALFSVLTIVLLSLLITRVVNHPVRRRIVVP